MQNMLNVKIKKRNSNIIQKYIPASLFVFLVSSVLQH